MKKLIRVLLGLGLVISLSLTALTLGYVTLAKSGRIARTIPAIDGIIAASTSIREQLRPVAEASDSKQEVPILMYHYIREVDASNDPIGYGLSVTPEIFTDQLDAIKEAGYKTITARQFLNGEYEANSIILTFDDGYRDFYEQALPALVEREMTAVVFVIYGSIDEDRYLTTSQLKEIVAAGIEVGSHTVSHPNLTSLEDTRLQQELMESRTALERLVGQRVTAVSYPAGEYDERVIRYADFVGYKFGVTTINGLATSIDTKLELPRIRVTGNESPEDLLSKINNYKN